MLIDQTDRDICSNPNFNVIARAPAGSGKTGILLLRMLNCLSRVARPESVLATTFTNKAANEMRERVIDALRSAKSSTGEGLEGYDQELHIAAKSVIDVDKRLGWRLLECPSRLRICTFDTFCGSLSKRLPILSGIGSGAIEESPDQIYREAVIETLANIESESAAVELKSAIRMIMGSAKNRTEDLVPLLSGLLAKRDQWIYEMLSPDVEMMEAQIHKLVMGVYNEQLAILMTHGLNSLLELFEQGSRFDNKLSWAQGITNVDLESREGMSCIRMVANCITTSSSPAKIKAKLTAREGFPSKKGVTAETNELLAEWKQLPEIETALLKLKSIPSPVFSDQSKEIIKSFSVLLKYLLAYLKISFSNYGKVDFIEVSYRAIESLGSEDAIGQALLDEDRIEHILVDEMQDTSLTQINLLERLTAHWGIGEGRSLFLCGDPMQSIYMFRGANVNLFTKVFDTLKLGSVPLKSAILRSNFRSSPEIVKWVNQTFSGLIGGRNSQLDGAVRFEESVPQKSNAGTVSVTGVVGSINDEAMLVARKIKESLPSDCSIAVLARTRTDLSIVSKALNQIGITTSSQDVDRLLNRRDVKMLYALIRAMAHPADRTAWFELLRSPLVGVSWADCISIGQTKSVASIVSNAEDDAKALGVSQDGIERLAYLNVCLTQSRKSGGTGITESVIHAWHCLKGPEHISVESTSDIDCMLKLLSECSESGRIDNLADFMRRSEKLYASPKPGRVQLMTIHKSKGLEFDDVYLVGLGQSKRPTDTGIFEWRRIYSGLTVIPHAKLLNSPTDEDGLMHMMIARLNQKETNEESKRLLYVGATRAIKTLSISGVVKENSVESWVPEAGSLLNKIYLNMPNVMIIDHIECESESNYSPVFTVRGPIGLPEKTIPTYYPRLNNSTAESVLSDIEVEKFDNLVERSIGVVFHKIMELEATRATISKRKDVKELSSSILTLLRRNGCPETSVVSSVDRVVSMMRSTMQSDIGKWILGAKKGYAELSVYVAESARISKLTLDRFFVENGIGYIVDYKTTRSSVVDMKVFARNESEKYMNKMVAYAEAIKKSGFKGEIRKMLFYPETQLLLDLD